MEQKSLRISGIKVIAGGLKGLEVNYETSSKDEKGRDVIVDMWQGRKVPIGPELAAIINAFKFYLYDIYGYDMAGINQAEMEILGVKAGNGSFLISGKMKVLDGTKTVAMNTPLITSADEYDKYMEVEKLVGQLYKSVAEYMDGKHVLSDADLVKKFYEGKTNKKGELLFDVTEFDKLPVEEQEAKALEVLTKLGTYIPVPVGDLGIMAAPGQEIELGSTEDVRGPLFQGDKKEEKAEEKKDVIVPNFEALPAGDEVKEDVKEDPAAIVVENEEEFVIHTTPVKTT